MNKVALVFSTRDRVELTRRSIEPLLPAAGGFDLHWCDGSDTEEGQRLYRDYSSVYAAFTNIRGGADAAIVYGLTTLLDHPNNYEFVGLVENDVLLHPDWFAPTMALFSKGEDEGLVVGAVSARCYEDRILCQRDGYALCHNLGAGMVIFRREAARLVLDNFRTGWTTDNRLLFAQLSGLDVGKWWAFRENEHAITSDWIYDAAIAAHGYASLALTPSPCEMIGQVPPLHEQGLTLARRPGGVEALRNDKAFETFATKTSLIRERTWLPAYGMAGRQQALDGTWTIFPHQFASLGAYWDGEWHLKWSQGFGPFSWKAGTLGNIDFRDPLRWPSLDLPVIGECALMVGGGPKGGDVHIFDPATGMDTKVRLAGSPNGDQVMSMVLPPVMTYRTVRLTAPAEGITVYALRTRNAQPWRPGVRFDHSTLPPV